MQDIAKKRGGHREGSGRKKTCSKRIAFRAPKDVVDILDGVDNMSKYICDAVREKAK